MQIKIYIIWIVMIFTPFLTSVNGKKVIFVIPKQMRRAYTPSIPKQQFNYIDFLKTKNLFNNEFITSMKNDVVNRHQDHSSMTSGLFNGDDYFDQGHEQVNHVVIPHGNGIKHTLTFGKGYIPHELLYHNSGLSSNNQHEIQQPINYEFYINNVLKKKFQDKIQEQKNDLLLTKYHPDKNSYNNINKQLFNGFKKYIYKTDNINDDIKLTSRDSSIQKLNKNKDIFTDTEFLNEYNKKLIDLTNNWPTTFNLQRPSGTEFKYGKIPNIDNFKQSDMLNESGWLPGTWINNNNQDKGYEVTENIEDIPLGDYSNLKNTFIPTRQAPQNIHLLLEQHQKLSHEIPNSYSL